jgi:hypothetical protein
MSQLTEMQRTALEDYATLSISLNQLLERLGNAIEISFGPTERKVLFHYDNRKPVVRIELRHIRDAMDKQTRGDVTADQLSDWAAMLLADPSYDWEGPDEDEIAGGLNEMALLSAPRAAGGRAVYEHVIDPSGKTVSFVQKL